MVSNSREGKGAIYQALYETSRTDADGRTVRSEIFRLLISR